MSYDAKAEAQRLDEQMENRIVAYHLGHLGPFKREEREAWLAAALLSAYRAGAEATRTDVRAVADRWETHARGLLCLDGPESDRLFLCATELRQRFPCECGHCKGRRGEERGE